MGKTLELLGMMAFNVTLILVASAALLNKASPAAAPISFLTEENITAFVREVTAVSGGESGRDAYSVTEFLIDHIAADATFKAVVKYDMPGDGTQEEVLSLEKMDFIGRVLEGQKTMQNHQSDVTLEYAVIAPDGKTARIMTTSRENGGLPTTDPFGDSVVVSVGSTSYCEQGLSLDESGHIQIKIADCTTYIEFGDVL
ncbi:MAG: hypothetical protein KDJ15_01385 [Alphaproteobacteria bacterium]|nr:hypothetical protein [Alphaproteobacteria bacterium]